jgi:hypothetical protein
VPTIEELQDRSEELFTRLLTDQAPRPASVRRRSRRRVALAPAAPVDDRQDAPFSWFDPEDAVAAAVLAFRLAALAGSSEDREEALSAALDDVEDAIGREHPDEIRQGFALFVTHNREGRQLRKPRTVAAAPELFNPPRGRTGGALEISIGGAAPGLDYWREDVLANEHHEHWHQVYPYTGLPPRSWDEWVAGTDHSDKVAILNAVNPQRDWDAIVSQASAVQLARLFADGARGRVFRDLPRNLYRKLFTLNDRQGELFFYMHLQMLARYDAELLSHDLARVEPFGPGAWEQPIAAGHDPIDLEGYGRREERQSLTARDLQLLEALNREIEDAIEQGALRGLGGQASVRIDRDNLGHAVEPTATQLRDLAEDAYLGLHGAGHVVIAGLTTPEGVMRNPVTAIRDQVFWQWHKYIDNLNTGWQDGRGREDFSDRPQVIVRNGLGDDEPWASPDIILCRTIDLPEEADLQEVGERLFGGDLWETDFSSGTAQANGTSLRTVDELTTTLASGNFGGSAIRYLTHEPFSYFLRIENTSDADIAVTARVFLAPAAEAHDRRMWIEMDKFVVALPPHGKVVAYRPDTESSVIKRPHDLGPARLFARNGTPGENSYCDCGWPYTLLLPRGKPQGMPFRLMVMCTDARLDVIDQPGHCGSVSYCGAVDRYPDARDMGYPFHRPFGDAPTALQDAILSLPNAAARTLRIRHA